MVGSHARRVCLLTAGKKKAYTALLQCRTFLCRKNGVHRGRISVVDMVFLVFIGFWYPPPAWKVFLFGQKSSPNDFLSVVVVYAFFLLCYRDATNTPHGKPKYQPFGGSPLFYKVPPRQFQPPKCKLAPSTM